jgi:hypothetical protein
MYDNQSTLGHRDNETIGFVTQGIQRAHFPACPFFEAVRAHSMRSLSHSVSRPGLPTSGADALVVLVASPTAVVGNNFFPSPWHRGIQVVD